MVSLMRKVSRAPSHCCKGKLACKTAIVLLYNAPQPQPMRLEGLVIDVHYRMGRKHDAPTKQTVTVCLRVSATYLQGRSAHG